MRRSATVIGLTTACLSVLLFLGCGGGAGGYGSSSSSGSTPSNIATEIVISPSTAAISMGGMQQYKAVTKNSSGTTITGVILTWTSSNTAVATVDSNGNASAVGTGTTSITASVTYNNNGVYTTGTGTTYTSNMATLTVTAMNAVMGTAATGHALSGALITLKDADGKSQSTVSGDDGRFSFSTAGLKAPFLMKADDGRGRVLFGTAAADGGANIDTATDLMVRSWYMAHGSTPEAAFPDMQNHPAPDGKSLSLIDKHFTRLLGTALTAEGLDSRHFSLVSTSFNADGTGFDAVLDHTRALTGSHLQLQDGLAGQVTDIGFEGKTMNLSTRGMDDAAPTTVRIDLP
ncbi:MAG TPA: Ig-like domain-containing protein [Gammaproteobacteria bacterium]|jgi:hypothetical protein